MISELKRAFEIDFLLFLPFQMLPLVVVSLPFKPIFFVLVAGSLIHSYGT